MPKIRAGELSRRGVWPIVGLATTALTVANFMVSGDEWALIFLGFGMVGTYITWKVPEHMTGRLMIVLALVTSLDSETILGVAGAGDWIGAAMPLVMGLFILTFPSGRLTTGWRLSTVGMACVITVIGFAVRVRTGDEGPAVGIPLGFFVLGALIDLILRYRKFDAAQKAQTKFVVIAALLTPVVLVAVVTTASDEWLGAASVAAFMMVPASVGVAIVRSGLYDIDRIISRTLAYAVVVALLASGYVVVVWVVTSLVPAQNSLAVAASTLAVAAAFNPLRRLVQSLVDRRFNRSHYQVENVVAEFAVRLKGALTMEELAGVLNHAVDETLQPRARALWIAAD